MYLICMVLIVVTVPHLSPIHYMFQPNMEASIIWFQIKLGQSSSQPVKVMYPHMVLEWFQTFLKTIHLGNQ